MATLQYERILRLSSDTRDNGQQSLLVEFDALELNGLYVLKQMEEPVVKSSYPERVMN